MPRGSWLHLGALHLLDGCGLDQPAAEPTRLPWVQRRVVRILPHDPDVATRLDRHVREVHRDGRPGFTTGGDQIAVRRPVPVVWLRHQASAPDAYSSPASTAVSSEPTSSGTSCWNAAAVR